MMHILYIKVVKFGSSKWRIRIHSPGLKIIYDEDQIGEYDLLALEEVKKVNIFSRLMKSLNFLIWGDV